MTEKETGGAYVIFKNAKEAMRIIMHRVGRKEKEELLDLMRGVISEAVQILDGAEYERVRAARESNAESAGARSGDGETERRGA
jgi:hypothetical protein